MSNLEPRLMSYSFLIAAFVVILASSHLKASEGGIDYYVPGVYGNIGLAEIPEPGAYYLNFMIGSSGEADIAVRGGQIHTEIDDTVFAQAFVPTYVTEKTILGGNYFVAAAFVFPEYVDVKSQLTLSDGTRQTADDSTTGLGDMTIIPFGIHWKKEDIQAFLYTAINVPTGYYSTSTPATLGLNYWAFDTNLGFTWEVTKQFNLDFDVGLLINTKNHETDYLSGNALHLDYTLGYNLSPKFSLGLSGYVYYQITGDSGSGALLGDFKGRAYGLGPSLQYIFGDEDSPVVANLAWQHDLDTENRIKSDWVVLMFGLPIRW